DRVSDRAKGPRACFRAIQHRTIACTGWSRIWRRALSADDRVTRLVAAGLVGARPRPAHCLVLAGGIRGPPDLPVGGDRKTWPPMDDPRDRAAWGRSGRAWAIPLAQASKLLDCCIGNRRGSARARVAVVGPDITSHQWCAAHLSDPHRKHGAGVGGAGGVSINGANPCQ